MDERKISALLARPSIDPAARAELLKIAATFLRNGATMPENLRLHLAGAFDAAAQADTAERAKVLAESLGLVGEANRPRKIGPIEVVKASAKSGVLSAGQLMAEYGISERTARQRIAEVRKAQQNLAKLMDDNGISSLVRKRNR